MFEQNELRVQSILRLPAEMDFAAGVFDTIDRRPSWNIGAAVQAVSELKLIEAAAKKKNPRRSMCHQRFSRGIKCNTVPIEWKRFSPLKVMIHGSCCFPTSMSYSPSYPNFAEAKRFLFSTPFGSNLQVPSIPRLLAEWNYCRRVRYLDRRPS